MDLDVDVHVAAAPSTAAPTEPGSAHRLPDVLRENLDVVFVGVAPARRSVELGVYYGDGGNLFWPTLWQVGLTPRRFTPANFVALQNLGIGFTDLCKANSSASGDVVVTRSDVAAFDAKVRGHAPRAIAFTSKKAASLWLRQRAHSIRYGRQKQRASDFCEVFALPSPSVAARRWWSIDPWHELADWLRATATWRF